MMFKLFLLFLFSTYVFAQNALIIPTGKVNLTSNNHIYIIKEDKAHDTALKVLNSNDMKLLKSSYVGIRNGPFWSKIDIQIAWNIKSL